MSQISVHMEFSIYGREVDSLVEGVTQFKYLLIALYQTDNIWPEIIWNVSREWKV